MITLVYEYLDSLVSHLEYGNVGVGSNWTVPGFPFNSPYDTVKTWLKHRLLRLINSTQFDLKSGLGKMVNQLLRREK